MRSLEPVLTSHHFGRNGTKNNIPISFLCAIPIRDKPQHGHFYLLGHPILCKGLLWPLYTKLHDCIQLYSCVETLTLFPSKDPHFWVDFISLHDEYESVLWSKSNKYKFIYSELGFWLKCALLCMFARACRYVFPVFVVVITGNCPPSEPCYGTLPAPLPLYNILLTCSASAEKKAI